MTKFTKATLIVAALVLAAAAWARMIGQAYLARGGWTVGGEWLIPAICAAMWAIGREIKKLYSAIKK